MIHYIVTYANSDNAHFNFDYYVNTHLPLGEQLLGEYGLVRTEVEKGLVDPAGKAPELICVTRLYFEDTERMRAGFARHGETLKADIENYSSVEPVFTLAESLKLAD